MYCEIRSKTNLFNGVSELSEELDKFDVSLQQYSRFLKSLLTAFMVKITDNIEYGKLCTKYTVLFMKTFLLTTYVYQKYFVTLYLILTHVNLRAWPLLSHN